MIDSIQSISCVLFSQAFTEETKDHYFYFTDKKTVPDNLSRVNGPGYGKAGVKVKSAGTFIATSTKLHLLWQGMHLPIFIIATH